MRIQVFYSSAGARILQHIAFWGLSYYILVHVFASSSEIQTTDYIYTIIFLITLAIGVYTNLYLLIPLFLNKRKYLIFGLLFVVCVVSSTWLNLITFSKVIDYLLPGYYFISYFSFADVFKIMLAFAGITSLIKLSKGYFLLLETRNQLMQLKQEKSDAELQALRAQVNPHFLFNCLNSIYSLVLKKSDKAPETVLRLSDILRYILYEARKEKVELMTELLYMQDYIRLQKLRCGPNATVEFRVEGEPNSRRITPLLFLPLIENSFKHGIKGETGPSFVQFTWIISADSVHFVAKNNRGPGDSPDEEKQAGIGLENLTKRLGLAYPGKHHFQITETGEFFSVDLTLQIADEP